MNNAPMDWDESLVALARLLHGALADAPLDDLLQETLERLIGLDFVGSAGSGSLLIVEGEHLVTRATVGDPCGQRGCDRVRLGECICGRAALRSTPHHEPCEHGGNHGHATVPIRSGAQPLGVINLYQNPGEHIEARGLHLIQAVADLLAGVIERKRAEQALRDSEERFRAIASAAAEAVILRDQAGRTVFWNPAATRLFGYTEAEVLGRPLHDLLIPMGTRPLYQAAFSGDSISMEDLPDEEATVPAVHRDGHTLAVDVRRSLLTIDGRPYLLTMVRDMTEQQQLRARLAQSERMAGIGALAAGVAHEINNPLSYVVTNLELATEMVQDPDLSALLSDAREGAERVRRIVRDLKAYSRASAEKDAAVDVNEVVRAALRLCRTELEPVARLSMDLEPFAPIRGSEGRLSQVLVNLVVNAIQAFRAPDLANNAILIQTRRVQDEIEIIIADNGPGIPKGRQARIFEPFFTTKPRGRGTGLGLWISKNAVESMGGGITLHSEPGAGARFTIRLPARPPDQPGASETADAPDQTTHRGRVLVIDDEPRIGRTLRRALRREHEVHVVTSAVSAQHRLSQGERYDAILCDMIMPEIDGAELHRWMREHHPDQAERVVFITGQVALDGVQQYLDTVDNPALDKPFDLPQLRELVRARVDRSIA